MKMFRQILTKAFSISLALLVAGCVRIPDVSGQAEIQTSSGGIGEELTASDFESSTNVSSTIIHETQNITPPIVTDSASESQEGWQEDEQEEWLDERRELMIPSEEFMDMRDEILIEILGIDGTLPIYHIYEDDPEDIELPYGGVLTKLGEYDHRIKLYELELGFDIIPASAARLYYPDLGLEVDVMYAGDALWDVLRYLYISNSSSVKLPSGIGIGSTREEVINEYQKFIIPDFHPMLTEEEVIALGSELNGIYFVIRDNHVYSIYVATIREDSSYSYWVYRKSLSWNLYPDKFYPDREYMASAH